MLSFSVALAFLAILTSVQADTSLFIPGFDEQPLSAVNLGVDAAGRTTWAIAPGALTGTWQEAAFYGTATLVEGPNDAHVSYANTDLSLSFDIECGLQNGVAACTAPVGYFTTPYIFTESAAPFIVQGGQPAPAPTSAASSLPSSPASVPTPSPSLSVPASSAPPSSSGFVTSASPSSLTASPSAPTDTELNPVASPAASGSSVPNAGAAVSASAVGLCLSAGIALMLSL
ncbi:hypothetical protein FA95DRAFT_1605494 [Auriscalpium vulgare]|uniref:Uncharacterized protein n=1 Tax=Auriscalpium vulgare TaxID=40419 RepID=A0ACB8RW90_9AGAM|nr:hypothetical protein FA95DRAFT_1605494 [Auriscalpium vulgare]